MIKLDKCPVCLHSNLTVLKHYNFTYPENLDFLNSSGLNGWFAYKNSRLWILFEKILNSKAGDFYINLCNSCGLIFLNPRFTVEEIITQYAIIDQLEDGKSWYQEQPPFNCDNRANRIYLLLNKHMDSKIGEHFILDYGGAEGHNLIPFLHAGDKCSLLDYVAYDHVKGIDYLGKNLEELPSNKEFDVILSCHIFEHLAEPNVLLNDLISRMSENGLIYVEVPLGCWEEWKNIHEPMTHVNFFSEESIVKWFKNAGLDVLFVSTSYQWVTHHNMWCINLIGKKSMRNPAIKFRTTKQQMNSLSMSLKSIYIDQSCLLKMLKNSRIWYYEQRFKKKLIDIIFSKSDNVD